MSAHRPADTDPDRPERGDRPAGVPGPGREAHFDGARGRWVGASVPRREDPRLLAGRGRFVDDIHLPGMLHAGFVRATVAHAEVTSVDLSATREVAGVVAAYDAADLGLGDIVALLDRPPQEFTPTTMPVLARGTVRFVGEPVALVVARDPYAVEDGIEAAVVEYDARPAVVSEETALAPGAPAVHDEAGVGPLPPNVLLDVSMFDTPGVDEAFERAAGAGGTVVDVTTRSARQNALPLETRGVVASWDDRDDQLLVQTCTQVPHQVRTVLARCLRVPERTVRVTVPDMGGGFGQKCVVGREEIAVAAAARRLDRPVKWIEDRREALTAAFLAREQRYRTRAAFDAEGHISALDVDVVCDMGAYSCYPFTAGIEPLMASAEMPGVYRVPAYRVRGRAITTNKAPTAPYRGVSRPQYVLAMERVMDKAARALGLDPVEIRRRNVITEFPYTGINDITYDPGYLPRVPRPVRGDAARRGLVRAARPGPRRGPVRRDRLLLLLRAHRLRLDAFAQRRMQVVPGFDISEIRMDTTGAVVVTTGTDEPRPEPRDDAWHRSSPTALGIDLAQVKLRQGDTDRITYGWGTFARRSIDDRRQRRRWRPRQLGRHALPIAAAPARDPARRRRPRR